MKKLLLTAIAFLLIASTAQAGGYVGASILSAGVDIEEGTLDYDESDESFKIWGGYNFFKFLGVEAAYNDYGDPSDNINVPARGLPTEVSVEPTAWTLAAKGTLPLGPIELFAKVGYFAWDTDGIVDDDGSDVGYGINGVSSFWSDGIANWGADATGEDGQFVLRTQLQLIF